jgi:cyclophilin family peptidyl-prolyl cis-trans isomerase
MKMNWKVVILCAVLAALAGSQGLTAGEEKMAKSDPVVVMETSMGAIKIELWADRAPETVRNFLRYVDDKFYDGTVFHRVIAGNLIQGGGFTEDMAVKETRKPIRNEAREDLKNIRGTIAMARTAAVHSATAQFYINLSDKPFLDHRDETKAGFGYAVFGRVIEGLDVADEIGRVPRDKRNTPLTPVIIKSVTRAGPAEKPPDSDGLEGGESGRTQP